MIVTNGKRAQSIFSDEISFPFLRNTHEFGIGFPTYDVRLNLPDVGVIEVFNESSPVCGC